MLEEATSPPNERGSSSSLSEPEDRSADDNAPQRPETTADAEMEAYHSEGSMDTEAETERLEKTPHAQRNVLLTPADVAMAGSEADVKDEKEDNGRQFPRRSASPDSNDEQGSGPSPSPSKKRKRQSAEAKGARRGGIHQTGESTPKSTLTLSPGRSIGTPEVTNAAGDPPEIDLDAEVVGKTVKRRSLRLGGEELVGDEELPADQDHLDVGESPDEASSNGEEVDGEDGGEEGVDAEGLAKKEEILMRKKVAMKSLGTMENHFATFRDKLYEERLAQCQDELAMLQRPTFDHPELALMKEVVDRRRNQKLHYEQTLLRFKLESLERESIAEKAQIHSQYMQAAGAARDAALAKINKAIYQTQRERRNCESEKSDYMYEFHPNRTQQITQQMAYNGEVSLLSGLAKYVGFPAAPTISSARDTDFDEDRRQISQNIAAVDREQALLQTQTPMLRASLSAASNFGRLHSGPDDHFIQQNAWANPQHPVHQIHRHASNMSQAETSSSTPSNQKQLSSQVQGSASTIPELPSGPNSSVVPTPATTGQAKHTSIDRNRPYARADVEETPSKVTMATSGVASSPPRKETHTSAIPPKESKFPPIIKAEDFGQIPRHNQLTGEFANLSAIGADAHAQRSRVST